MRVEYSALVTVHREYGDTEAACKRESERMHRIIREILDAELNKRIEKELRAEWFDYDGRKVTPLAASSVMGEDEFRRSMS